MPRELYGILVLTCAPSGFEVRTGATVSFGIYNVGATVRLAGDNPKLAILLDPPRAGYL